MGMVVLHAFHSCWRLFQLYPYCTVVKWHFSSLCSDLNFPFCICRAFGRLSLVLSFFMRYSTKPLQTNSYIILQKYVICWSMGALTWVVSKNESSWSKFVHMAIWLPLGHWILGFLVKSLGCFHSAVGSWTLLGCSWFISPSLDLHSLFYLFISDKKFSEINCTFLIISNFFKHTIYIYIYIYKYINHKIIQIYHEIIKISLTLLLSILIIHCSWQIFCICTELM